MIRSFFNRNQFDRQYEFDQGVTAVERNDEDGIFGHCVKLLCNDKTDPNGWILRAALQLHGEDFDLDKATMIKSSLLAKAMGKTYCSDQLRDASASYKRAIGYSKDDSVLYQYAFIFGYSLAYYAGHHSIKGLSSIQTVIERMIEETNMRFGHDCSELFFSRMIRGVEECLATGSFFEPKDVRAVLRMLRSLKDPSSEKEDDDSDTKEHYCDSNRLTRLTVMKGKKSCADYPKPSDFLGYVKGPFWAGCKRIPCAP